MSPVQLTNIGNKSNNINGKISEVKNVSQISAKKSSSNDMIILPGGNNYKNNFVINSNNKDNKK